MKASEIREMTADELNSKLADLKAELFNLRFQLAINQLDNPMRISAVKKDIARVKTVIRENELRAVFYVRGRGRGESDYALSERIISLRVASSV